MNMAGLNQSLNNWLEKRQGTIARIIDRLPSVAQNRLAKALNYPYVFEQLDPFIQCLMAAQHQQGKQNLLSENYLLSRQQFENQIRILTHKVTPLKKVQNLRLPLQSGTVCARHYHPAPHKKLPMIIFYHGGGFVVGSLDTHDEICRLLALHAKAQVLSIAYPLAPEASPQLLIQSCEDALAWVYQNRRQLKILNGRIAVAGDSAGGNISAVIAQRSATKKYAPSAQLLIYPTVDFKSRHPSFFAYKEGLTLTQQDVDVVTALYAEQHAGGLEDPLLSPTYGMLKGLAPAYVLTAGHDLLHDEAEIYAIKLKQHGNKVIYQNCLDQPHGFVNLTTISSRAKRHTITMAKNFRTFWDKHSKC